MQTIFKKEDERIFIPLVRPNTPKNIIQEICQNSKFIALNHYEIQRQKSIYNIIKSKGLHDFYNIPNQNKVVITSTAPDIYLLFDLFSKDNHLKFKQDILNFNPDYFMAPDLLTYPHLNDKINNLFIEKAKKFGLACSKIKGMLPNIHGINDSQMNNYIEPFKKIGYEDFILPSREYIINLKGRVKDEQILSSIVNRLKKRYKINLLLTGPSTPRQHRIIYSANGFIGLGYLTLAMQRILFKNFKTINIMESVSFKCFNSCCDGLNKTQIVSKKYDSNRIIHNLLSIQNSLKLKIKNKQLYFN